MSMQTSYPGVYIEEVPSGVRTIMGVGTAVTAFVGYTKRGPIDEPVTVFNFGDYERTFGPLDPQCELGYAVHQYFLNGGGAATVVRVTVGAAVASVTMRNGGGTPAAVLTVKARELGTPGNALSVEVDHRSSSNPRSLFGLRITRYGADADGGVKAVASESYTDLSMNSAAARYAVRFVNARSQLVELVQETVTPPAMPGSGVEAAPYTLGTSTSGDLSTFMVASLTTTNSRVRVSVNEGDPFEIQLVRGGDAPLVTLGDLAARIVSRIQEHRPDLTLRGDAVPVGASTQIVIESRTDASKRSVRFFNASTQSAAQPLRLGLENGGAEVDGMAFARPVVNETVGGADVNLMTPPSTGRIEVRVHRGASYTAVPLTVYDASSGGAPASPALLVDRLRNAMYASPADPALRAVNVALRDGRLVLSANLPEPNLSFELATPAAFMADSLLSQFGMASSIRNVTRYALGLGATGLSQQAGSLGADGTPPSTAGALLGREMDKTGLYALEKADYFSLLCLPNSLDEDEARSLYQQAAPFCERRRAMLFVDIPASESDDPRSFLGSLRHKNAVAYHPRIKAPDFAQGGALQSFASCGAIAGVYARTDAERGVWKAPAGMDATIRGVQALDRSLTEGEIGGLNRQGINGLRTTPLAGSIVWGARTLVGADDLASEWKYVPVRRLALYIEESLFRGTQWVVFEPNDEPLWSQIRLNVGSFMQTLFRQGAFQGKSPREAYLVKCDRETTTQDDINRGVVNVVVGFAPLKPAEFVFLKIQQLAGQNGV